ncbi:MAG: magnesium and cobalt transport protein CorA, partial [Desulfobacterales bacterium]|nr:magnesium and cobalt transport protein CorA [Desulfobacterales bacterium]
MLSDLHKDHVNWINVNGIHKVDVIDKIGEYFSLHPLLLEDILTIDQPPKLEEYDECLFITLKMIAFNSELFKIEHEHVSFVLGKNFVLSFQEKEGDVFNLIRKRIEHDKGKVRKMKADYLFY